MPLNPPKRPGRSSSSAYQQHQPMPGRRHCELGVLPVVTAQLFQQCRQLFSFATSSCFRSSDSATVVYLWFYNFWQSEFWTVTFNG
jgi:hypothetical protein